MQGSETTEGDGQTRTTENVVRLPRDWLGPREELVPIGSRADALDRLDGDTTSRLPPAASSFWDEDSGSVQAAMQAPAGEWQSPRPEPTAAPPKRHRRPRIHARWPETGPLSTRGRASLALGVIATCVIAALAVIGLTESSGSPPARRSPARQTSSATPIARGEHRAGSQALTPKVTQVRTERRSRHTAPVPHRPKPTRHRRHISRTSSSTSATSEPAQTSAPVSTPPPATTPTATTLAPTTPAASNSGASTTAKSTSSGGRQPAFGPTGSLGPGSSPDS
jgi:hypothetical protein